MTASCAHDTTAKFMYNDHIHPISIELVCVKCGETISTTEAATPNDLVGERHVESGRWHPQGTAQP